jgi:hypothetical protein
MTQEKDDSSVLWSMVCVVLDIAKKKQHPAVIPIPMH